MDFSQTYDCGKLFIQPSIMETVTDQGQEETGMTEDEMVGWMSITDSMYVNLSKLLEMVKDREG